MRTGPTVYADDLGEVVRGYRLYTGLSREAMAVKLGMGKRTYERIEDGWRDCPPGLFDTLTKVVAEFDEAVEDTLMHAGDGFSGGGICPQVSWDVDKEWERCVANRAAMMSEKVTPRLV